MSCQFLEDHRTTCGVAFTMCELAVICNCEAGRTFVDVNVLRSTATVCSCAATSSIVLGRLRILHSMEWTINEMINVLFFYPGLRSRFYGSRYSRFSRSLWLEERHGG